MTTFSVTAHAALNNQTHSHPIPNRDTILKLLNKHGNALHRKQLATRMKLSGNQELEGLKRRLRAMERDGQITFDRNLGYSPQHDDDIITGRVVGNKDGFGFLVPDNGGDDLFIENKDMMQLMDGDCIQVRQLGVNHQGRKKASLLKVIKRNTTKVVGKLSIDQGDYFITPENSRNAYDIDIDHDHVNGAREGQYVVVTITHYPCQEFRTFGKVTEILGNAMAPGMEIDVAIREHDIPHVWPKAATKAASELSKAVIESDKLHRSDLRQFPFVTIDGEDAQDFDDAIYCEPKGKGWRLLVAIADVSHYVVPGSALDREAQKRGTSVYFPGRVIPMLPEALSNGLCSLNPHVDRLAMVCDMTVNAAGKMTSYQFSEAVIHSHARLTYNQVNAYLTNPKSKLGKADGLENAELAPHINALHKLYGALSKARNKRGSLDFDTQETQFQFNKQRKVRRIVPVVRNDAHKLVEECMLCANVATARFLQKLSLPAMYRNHNGPKQDKLSSLRAFLQDKNLKLGGGDEPKPIHYDRVLSNLHDRNDTKAIQSVMLRSLSQAEYSPYNAGHFGLAYSAYAHFTSPIRRYPDLLVHRGIKSVIRGHRVNGSMRQILQSIGGIRPNPVKRNKNTKELNPKECYPYDKKIMHTLAVQCSEQSRRADKASWDVDAWLKCDYMRGFIGDTFTGVISAVTKFGFFVELTDSKIEGLVHISSLKNEIYHFDEKKQALIGNRAIASYEIGDTVLVQVNDVDMESKKIGFQMGSQSNAARNRKNARTRNAR